MGFTGRLRRPLERRKPFGSLCPRFGSFPIVFPRYHYELLIVSSPAEYLSSSTTIKLSEQTFPSFDQIEYLSRRRANSALLSCEIAKILFLQTEDDDTVESAGFIASIEDSYMTEESKALKEAFEAALKRGRKESAWMEMAIAK